MIRTNEEEMGLGKKEMVRKLLGNDKELIASPSGHPPTLHLSYLFVVCIRRRRRTDIRR